MPASTPEMSWAGDRLIVEARTAAEALEVVTRHLGTSARVVAVETVLRGGVGGFFARQLVQIVAEPAVSGPVGPVAPSATPPAAGGPAAGEGPTEPIPGASTFAALLRAAAEADGGAPSTVAGSASAPRPSASSTAPLRAAEPTARSAPSPDADESPVAVALTRLLTGAVDAANFGEALRTELRRTGWRPEHGNPARGVVTTAVKAPADTTAGTVTAAVAEATAEDAVAAPSDPTVSRIIRVDDTVAPTTAGSAPPAAPPVPRETAPEPGGDHRRILEPVRPGGAPLGARPAGPRTQAPLLLQPATATRSPHAGAAMRGGDAPQLTPPAQRLTAPRVGVVGTRP